MASRPAWTGSLGFGLVNIPVRLHLAARSERFAFHQLHEADMGRIRYQRVCEVDGEEVPWEKIVKGYEYAKGEYVTITDKDLESIDIGLQKTIDIERFVDGAAIDPVYYDRPYHVEPAQGAERAYALLRDVLVQSGKVGIGRVVFRDREYLAAVRPRGEVLGLDTLRFQSELRDAKDLNLPSGAAGKLPARQVELARTLVDQLSGDWTPEEFKDRYHDAMKRLIERKLEGTPMPKAHAPRPTGKVLDLTEVLRRSLEKSRPAQGEHRAPRAKQAARRVRKPSASGRPRKRRQS